MAQPFVRIEDRARIGPRSLLPGEPRAMPGPRGAPSRAASGVGAACDRPPRGRRIDRGCPELSVTFSPVIFSASRMRGADPPVLLPVPEGARPSGLLRRPTRRETRHKAAARDAPYRRFELCGEAVWGLREVAALEGPQSGLMRLWSTLGELSPARDPSGFRPSSRETVNGKGFFRGKHRRPPWERDEDRRVRRLLAGSR
jgi:hypothetical protein